jgi:hypothetical protein
MQALNLTARIKSIYFSTQLIFSSHSSMVVKGLKSLLSLFIMRLLTSSSSPILSVKAPVMNCFRKMVCQHFFFVFKICNGAGYLQNAVVGAGRQPQFVHGILYQFIAGFVQLHIFANQR